MELHHPWGRVCDRFTLVMLFVCAISLSFSTAGLEVGNYLALTGFLVGGHYAQKGKFLVASPFALSALGLYAIVLLCSLYSTVSWAHITGEFRAYEKLLLIPVGLWTLHRFPKHQSHLLIVLGLGLLTNFLLGLLKVHHLWPTFLQNTVDPAARASFGSFKGSGHIALSYFASIATFCVGVILIRHYAGLSLWQRVVLLFSTGFGAFYLLAVNDGRSGLVTFAVLLGYLILRLLVNFRAYKMGVVLLILCGVVGMGAWHYSSTLNRMIGAGASDLHQYQLGNTDTSWGERITFWKNSLTLIRAKPVLGYGTGSMSTVYAALNTTHDTHFVEAHNPHNQYLFFMVDQGLPGLIGFGLLLLFAFRHGVTLKTAAPKTQTLTLLLEASVLAFAAGCCFNSWLHDVHEGTFSILIWVGWRALLERSLATGKKIS